MWDVSGNNLQMCEADYGIELPVSVSGTTLGASDTLKFVFKKSPNGETMLVSLFKE